MESDRRAILYLVALRRIAPAEAERLLIACSAGREAFWVFAACITVAVAATLNLPQGLPALMHMAHALRAGDWLHRALPLATHLSGGIR